MRHTGRKLSTAPGAVQGVDLVAAFRGAKGEADRVRSAVALGSVSVSRPAALAALVAAALDEREAVRRAAAHGLAHGGDAAVGALLRLLQETSAPGARFDYQTDKFIFALGRAGAASSPSLMEESATAIGREMTAAGAVLAKLLAALSVEERAEMRRAALNGNRGYDGLVYSGEVMPHAQADDARSVLAEG